MLNWKNKNFLFKAKVTDVEEIMLEYQNIIQTIENLLGNNYNNFNNYYSLNEIITKLKQNKQSISSKFRSNN